MKIFNLIMVKFGDKYYTSQIYFVQKTSTRQLNQMDGIIMINLPMTKK